jgi:hypothetical protein
MIVRCDVIGFAAIFPPLPPGIAFPTDKDVNRFRM